jgi:hypothetical protein
LKKACGLPLSTSNVDTLFLTNSFTLQQQAEQRTVALDIKRRSFGASSQEREVPLGLRTVELRQFVIPCCPPAPEADGVVVLPDPTTKETRKSLTRMEEGPRNAILLRANEDQHQRMLAHVPPDCSIFEVWTDGSVGTVQDATGREVEGAGAAMVIWTPPDFPVEPAAAGASQPSSPLVHTHHIRVPRLAESFTAELAGPLVGIRDSLIPILIQYKALFPDRGIAVLLNSDGQSWIKTLARGPLANSPYASPLWSATVALAKMVKTVIVGFKFAHCGDPNGDVVDAAAKAAAEAYGPVGTDPWSVDVARHKCRTLRQEARADQFRTCGVFIKSSFPGPEIRCPLPPLGLSPGEARDILRLRTGHWWRQGLHTIWHGKPPQPCAKCKDDTVLLSRDNGPAVAHMFVCPKREEPARPRPQYNGQTRPTPEPPPSQTGTAEAYEPVQPQSLFSDDIDTLRQVRAFCLQFAVLAPSHEIPGSSESSESPESSDDDIGAILDSSPLPFGT